MGRAAASDEPGSFQRRVALTEVGHILVFHELPPRPIIPTEPYYPGYATDTAFSR
ncbi:MAG: hypothetical protein M3P34_07455 [Actinomycetota bacterium]|nr:hypothetical protein [Actinomycetota bacterium]